VNITYTAVSNIDLRNPLGFDVCTVLFPNIRIIVWFSFQVCCVGSNCSNDTLWVPSLVSSKNGLTITLSVNSSCVEKQLYGLRYLWRETPCLFKQGAIYSATDPNLPSPPYLKLF
jgi:sialate O-acetylesterase